METLPVTKAVHHTSSVYLPDMGASEHAYGQIMKALFKGATGEGSGLIHVPTLVRGSQ